MGAYPNRTQPACFCSKATAEYNYSCISHELGHNLGDYHESTYDSFGVLTEVYGGKTDDLHGALMGSSDGIVNKWKFGHYCPSSVSYSPGDLQSDLAVIAERIVQYAPQGYTGDGYAPDDYQDLVGPQLQPLDVNETTQSATGVIERLGDADAFRFTSAGGAYSIVAQPDVPSGLDAKLSIYDSAGTLLALPGRRSAVPAPDDGQRRVGHRRPSSGHVLRGGGESRQLRRCGVLRAVGGVLCLGLELRRRGPASDAWQHGLRFRLTGIHRCRRRYRSGEHRPRTVRLPVGRRGYNDRGPGDGRGEHEHLGPGRRDYSRKTSTAKEPAPPRCSPLRRRARSSSRARHPAETPLPRTTSPTTAPLWLKLERFGDRFTAYRSTDGSTWARLGDPQTIPMSSAVYVGLITSSGNSGRLCHATYAHVSVARNATPQGGLPAPSGVVVRGHTSNSVSLQWDDSGGETGYVVERSSDGVVFTPAGSTSANVTSFTSTGLADAQRYFFRVRAQDAAGVSAASVAVGELTRAGAVSGLSVTNWTASALILNWSDASGETGYRVERSADGANWVSVAVLGVNVPSYTDVGLSEATAYDYRIVTLDAEGDAASATVGGATRWSAQVVGLTATSATANQVALAWSELGTENCYLVQRGTDPNVMTTIATLPAGTTNYLDSGRSPLTEYYYRVLPGKQLASGVAWGQFSGPLLAATRSASPLPIPWHSQDVGAVGGPGAAGCADGIYTVIGSGANIWGAADQLHYLYRTLGGNGSIVAHVSALETDASSWSMAGVFIRESLNAGAKYAAAIYTSANGTIVQDRTSTDGSSHFSAPAGNPSYRWLRLTRSGDTFTEEGSTDGVHWIALGAQTVSMAGTVYIGMGTCSHNNAQLVTATFDNVSIAGEVAPVVTSVPKTLPEGTRALAIGFDQSVSGASDNYTLTGLGPDGLLGTADDVPVPLGVSYAGSTATLSLDGLTPGVFRLTVGDAVTNRFGIRLDGDGDGLPGGDWTGDFVVLEGSGAGPITLTNFDFGYGEIRGTVAQPDDKVIAAGYLYSGTDNDFALLRYNSDGSLDSTFDGDGKVTTAVGAGDDYIAAVVLQPDGKIVVAGYSYNGSNYDFALARYNPDGSLDTGFGSGGKVTTAVGTGADYAYGLAVQTDGKLVAVGYATMSTNDFAVVRYNANGSLDTGFGTGGKVTTPIGAGADGATSVAIQTDGKLVVAGYGHNGTNQDFAVVRYTASGGLDTGFGAGGKVTTAFGSGNDYAYGVAIQGDGKILVAGYGVVGSYCDFALACYSSTGSLDPSFGSGGKVTTAVGPYNDYGYAMALQPDGKILAAGAAYIDNRWEFAAARYNPSGSLDTSFDGDGVVITPIRGGPDLARCVAPLPGGQIVVAGSAATGTRADFAVVRYNADGSLDTGFDGDGKSTPGGGASYDEARGVLCQPDGKTVVVGTSNNGSSDKDNFALARYRADGTLDSTFGSGGRVVAPLGSYSDFAMATALQPDGKILAAGYAVVGSYYDFALARFNADGTLDTTFGTGGKVTTSFSAYNDYAYAIALQPDGKIVVAGAAGGSTSDIALARYNANGSLDSTFDGDGKLTTAIGSGNDCAYALALQPDGKIVVVGYAMITTNDLALLRYNPNGSLDTSFASGGIVTTSIGNSGDYAFAVALQPDGKILAAGYSWLSGSYDFTLARYNSQGSLDPSFDGDGLLTTAIGAGNDCCYAVALQADGKILAAGYASNGTNDDVALACYLADGSLDTSFHGDGKLTLAVGPSNDRALGIALAADGKILLAGQSSSGTNSDILMATVVPEPAAVTLASPTTAFDVDTCQWGAGQLLPTADGPLDGLGRLRVDGADFIPPPQVPTLDDGGQTVVIPAATMSGLVVHREVTVPGAGGADLVRTIDVFSNPTGAAITVTVTILGNLRSDAATMVFGSFDGDTAAETTDQWIGTDDADGSGAAAVVHCLHGPLGLQPSSVSVAGDNLQWCYVLTVPAGQTVRLVHFTIIASTRAAARAEAEALVSGFGDQAAAFLTPEELASLANYQFTPASLDVDGNGRADALSDGILMLRYLFDPTGPWNYLDALGAGATRTTRAAIKTFLDGQRQSVLDADGNGRLDALTDGILILRYLFAPTGEWNYLDALGTGATRATRGDIRAYLDQCVPARNGLLAEATMADCPLAADRTSEALAVTSVPESLGATDGGALAKAPVAASPRSEQPPAAFRKCAEEDRDEPRTAVARCDPSPQLPAVDAVLSQWAVYVSVGRRLVRWADEVELGRGREEDASEEPFVVGADRRQAVSARPRGSASS